MIENPKKSTKNDETNHDNSNCINKTTSTKGQPSTFDEWITLQTQGFVRPSHLLLLSSIPLFTGAFIGYRRAMKTNIEGSLASTPSSESPSLLSQLVFPEEAPRVAQNSRYASDTIKITPENLVSASNYRPSSSVLVKAEPAALAISALAIGSLLSLGGVGLLASGIFYASGADSLDELLKSLRQWVPQKRQSIEHYWGISSLDERYASDEDVKIIRQYKLNEDQEIEYYRRKYMPEYQDDEIHEQFQKENKQK